MIKVTLSNIGLGTHGMAILDNPLPLPNMTTLRVESIVNAEDLLAQLPPHMFPVPLQMEDDMKLAPTDDRGTSTCGFTMSNLDIGTVGYISSPAYPANYPPDVKCVWWFQAVSGAKISLTCTDVLTQTCDAGYFDYVLVSPDWSWVKYYLLCGDYSQYTPINLVSNDNFMSVYFRTSTQKNYRGFQCRYEVVGQTTTAAPTTQSPALQYNGEVGCGVVVNDTSASRIVGGTEVTPHRYPWMAGLVFNGQWFCGGSLLNKEWVLTAAHCVKSANSSYVYLGAHNLFASEPGRLIIYSQDFIIHPEYEAFTIANDVALVRLPKHSVVTYTSHISPMCLPARGATDTLLQGTSMQAVGWGKTASSTSITATLNELSMSLVSNEICTHSYGDIIVRPTNVCAQGMNGTGTCQGDSGSSLQYRSAAGVYIQYGVVSFGANTGCGSGYPNGFSRLTQFLDFIGQTIGTSYN